MRFLILLILIGCNDEQQYKQNHTVDDVPPHSSVEINGNSYFKTTKYVDHPFDLKLGEIGRDFRGLCDVYRGPKGVFIKCDQGRCSDLQQKYLSYLYSTLYEARVAGKQRSKASKWITLRKQRKWEKCKHKYNLPNWPVPPLEKENKE